MHARAVSTHGIPGSARRLSRHRDRAGCHPTNELVRRTPAPRAASARTRTGRQSVTSRTSGPAADPAPRAAVGGAVVGRRSALTSSRRLRRASRLRPGRAVGPRCRSRPAAGGAERRPPPAVRAASAPRPAGRRVGGVGRRAPPSASAAVGGRAAGVSPAGRAVSVAGRRGRARRARRPNGARPGNEPAKRRRRSASSSTIAHRRLAVLIMLAGGGRGRRSPTTRPACVLPDADRPAAGDHHLRLRQQDAVAQLGERTARSSTIDADPRARAVRGGRGRGPELLQHDGIDLWGIARAAWNNLTGGDTQGASTITQQYARNAAKDLEVTYARKLREAVMAAKLERRVHQGRDPGVLPQHRLLRPRRVRHRGGRQAYFGKSARAS